MIQQRWTWLLRNPSVLFDTLPEKRVCRICRLQEKGEVAVPVEGLDRHLAAHRREKVVKPEAVA